MFNTGLISKEAFVGILIIIAWVFIGASIIASINTWLRIHFLNRLENNIIADMKRKFFNHILDLDHNFHTSHKTGSMISRILFIVLFCKECRKNQILKQIVLKMLKKEM